MLITLDFSQRTNKIVKTHRYNICTCRKVQKKYNPTLSYFELSKEGGEGGRRKQNRLELVLTIEFHHMQFDNKKTNYC